MISPLSTVIHADEGEDDDIMRSTQDDYEEDDIQRMYFVRTESSEDEEEDDDGEHKHDDEQNNLEMDNDGADSAMEDEEDNSSGIHEAHRYYYEAATGLDSGDIRKFINMYEEASEQKQALFWEDSKRRMIRKGVNPDKPIIDRFFEMDDGQVLNVLEYTFIAVR